MGWGFDRSKTFRGALTINAQNEILLCNQGAAGIDILKFSRDDIFLETKPIEIPIEINLNPISTGFCAGERGELVIHNLGKLYFVK